jgi:hypothetical protein
MTRASEWVRSLPNARLAGTDPEVTAQPRAIHVWTAALILLCFGSLWLEFRHIESTLPYPLHVDEGFIAGPARRTLETGTLHPYTFNYPSLPKYLAAVGMAVGFLRDAARLGITQVRHIGNVNYPYYDQPRVIQSARQLFALLSVIALAATGASAWLAFRKPATILLAPLILLTSPLYFFDSWAYLNVDIVGTCFVMLAIAACLLGTRRPSMHQSAILPAVFAGLATGSKYTLAVVILPVLLAIGFHFGGARRRWAWAVALATTAAAFFAAVPYSLIDIPAFLNGVAWEAFHYASGHRGSTGEPGLPQLLYYGRHFASEFGVAGVILAVVGISVYAASDWRRAAVLAAFPIALLWLLASQRVRFERNVLSLHPLVAMFAAFGLLFLHGWVLRLAARREWTPRTLKAVLAGLALMIAAVPLWHFAGHLRDRTDSRNVALAWLEERIPRGWTIVVPKELAFDRRKLEARGWKVRVVDFEAAQDTSDVPSPAVVMVPRFGADSRYSGQERANALNKIARRWQVIQTFGTNDVLVNYTYATAWGDPAFAVAVLK